MRTVLTLLAVIFLGIAATSQAASSPESLWLSGAQFENKLPAVKALPGDPVDPAVLLKRTKQGLDRCYRLDMDYKMLAATKGEVAAELEKFAADPQPATRDRVETLLKFLADAMPVEGDRMDAVRNVLDYLYYDLPSKPDAELAKAVKDLDATIVRIAASVADFSAESAKLQARAAELEASLGGRAPWLALKLSEDAAAGTKFMDYVKERSAKVVARIEPKS